MNYLWLIVILVITINVIFIYIKLKIGFWATQPVFHIYDLQYYFCSPTIISKKIPNTRYINNVNVKTVKVDQMTEQEWSLFIKLIQNNYLRNDTNKYMPHKINVEPYFKGHNNPCFYSYYTNKEIIACITSRPLTVITSTKTFTTYYVDYLCVTEANRKSGIAPQIIQTHYANQLLNAPLIKTCLFKKEGDLTCIVPLCVYDTIGYNMNDIIVKLKGKPAKIFDAKADSIQIEALNFLKESIKKFKLRICTEIGNLIELINTKNIYIYLLKDKACYIYREMCVDLDKNNAVISLIGSINKTTNNNFVNGFLHTLKLFNNKYRTLSIENISDNDILINSFGVNPIIKTSTAYFFYNYVHPTMDSKNLFILT